jgi:hypothetical protein
VGSECELPTFHKSYADATRNGQPIAISLDGDFFTNLRRADEESSVQLFAALKQASIKSVSLGDVGRSNLQPHRFNGVFEALSSVTAVSLDWTGRSQAVRATAFSKWRQLRSIYVIWKSKRMVDAQEFADTLLNHTTIQAVSIRMPVTKFYHVISPSLLSMPALTTISLYQMDFTERGLNEADGRALEALLQKPSLLEITLHGFATKWMPYITRAFAATGATSVCLGGCGSGSLAVVKSLIGNVRLTKVKICAWTIGDGSRPECYTEIPLFVSYIAQMLPRLHALELADTFGSKGVTAEHEALVIDFFGWPPAVRISRS